LEAAATRDSAFAFMQLDSRPQVAETVYSGVKVGRDTISPLPWRKKKKNVGQIMICPYWES
jgi:hypothetical protein